MAFRKTWVTIVGWLLVLAGVAALALPGPGLLLLLAGLVILSQEYTWAERRVDPVAAKAVEVAKQGVSTWPRIVLSALSACLVIAFGVVWWMAPEIPEIGPIGPEWPLGGWGTGSGIVLSGFIALGLLIYSVVRWRDEAVSERRTAQAERRAAKERSGSSDVVS